MYTQCPNCKTFFRINSMQLNAASGQVRCGQCKTPFSALDALLDKVPTNNSPTADSPNPSTTPRPQNTDLKNTQVSPNLDSDIEQLDRDFDPISEIKALKSRRNTNDLVSRISDETLDDLEQDLTNPLGTQKTINELEQIEDLQSIGLEEFSLDLSDDPLDDNNTQPKKPKKTTSHHSLFAQNGSGLDGYIKDIDSAAEAEDIFKDSDRVMIEDQSVPTVFKEEGNESSPSNDYISQELGTKGMRSGLLSKLLWVSLISLLVIVLMGQLLYFKRAEFSQNPSMRPLVELLCNNLRPFIDCVIPAARDIKAIELTERDVRSHPKLENTLLITASIVSNAPFRQPFPNMVVRFTNVNQEVIAERLFEPNEYLGPNIDLDSGMQSAIPIKVKLEIIDPGSDATSFEFDFK